MKSHLVLPQFVVAQVSEWLGHRNTQITHDRYEHVINRGKNAELAIKTLSSAFSGWAR